MEKCLKILLQANNLLSQISEELHEQVQKIGQLEGVIQFLDAQNLSITASGPKQNVDQFVDFCYQLQSKLKVQSLEIIPQIYDQKLFRGTFRILK